MTIIVIIDQKNPAFVLNPTETTKTLMAHIGRNLTEGSVEGTMLDVEGRHVCSWRVTEYDK